MQNAKRVVVVSRYRDDLTVRQRLRGKPDEQSMFSDARRSDVPRKTRECLPQPGSRLLMNPPALGMVASPEPSPSRLDVSSHVLERSLIHRRFFSGHERPEVNNPLTSGSAGDIETV